MQNEFYPFINLPLRYPYDALEPFIDERTMMLHHNRHLKTYIDNLNRLLKDNPRFQSLSLGELIVLTAGSSRGDGRDIHNNAGGVFNHRFFFDGLGPYQSGGPRGALLKAIEVTFGTLESFLDKFRSAALSVFGSGYAWLVYRRGSLKIITTANQNTPLEEGYTPILALDVWEHAYYLKHYNRRDDYISDFFSVIDWSRGEVNFLAAN